MIMFWAIAIGGAAFDLATKTLVFRGIGEPGNDRHLTLIPNVLDLRTSYNAGALWGLGNDLPHSVAVFAVASIVAGVFICYYLFGLGNAGDRRQTSRRRHYGRRDRQLLRPHRPRTRSRLRPHPRRT